MEKTRRTVDELNELAYKMTGTNPQARTDAQALNYIEQNYQGGGSNSNGPLFIDVTELNDAFYDDRVDITQNDYPNCYASVKNAFEKAHIDSETLKSEKTTFILNDGGVLDYLTYAQYTDTVASFQFIKLTDSELYKVVLEKIEDKYYISYVEVALNN